MNKEKVKEFWNKHKEAIIVAGIAGVCIVTRSKDTFERGYKIGAMDGAAVGFHKTMDWFEKEFPDIKLHELWENYKSVNPDRIVTHYVRCKK